MFFMQKKIDQNFNIYIPILNEEENNLRFQKNGINLSKLCQQHD